MTTEYANSFLKGKLPARYMPISSFPSSPLSSSRCANDCLHRLAVFCRRGIRVVAQIVRHVLTSVSVKQDLDVFLYHVGIPIGPTACVDQSTPHPPHNRSPQVRPVRGTRHRMQQSAIVARPRQASTLTADIRATTPCLMQSHSHRLALSIRGTSTSTSRWICSVRRLSSKC